MLYDITHINNLNLPVMCLKTQITAYLLLQVYIKSHRKFSNVND